MRRTPLSRRIVVVASLAALLSLVTAPPSAAGPGAANVSGLRPGDQIRLAFWREPELSGEYPVDEAGTVVLPLLGRRDVLGVPRADLKRQLVDEYQEQLRNQEVQITFLQRVRVLGAVRDPGLYQIDGTMTLGDLVAMAGGVANDGTLKGVRVQRFGEEDDVFADIRIEAPVADQLRSGDQILVPQKSWISRHGTFLVGTALSIGFLFVAVTRYR